MLTINFFYGLTLWMKKIDSAKLTAKPTTLKRLPPTDEALDLNILRGNIQGAHWHYSVTGEPSANASSSSKKIQVMHQCYDQP